MPFPLHLLPLFVLALGASLGFITCPGVLWALPFIALVSSAQRLPQNVWNNLVMLYGLLLAAHLLPGFQPWTLRPAEQISADAPPYTLRLSWDKLLVAVTLLCWWLSQRQAGSLHSRLLVITTVLTILLIPGSALLVGVVTWQPKWPQMLWPWLAINLGVAVLAEELLFRGVLQRQLVAWLGAGPGILATALLFGAAHLPFSPLFALVATLAGLGYGLAFHFSGRLSVAILLHGLVNLLHLLLLSYPLRLNG